MKQMTSERFSMTAAGVIGFLGVALGAFGAHGLQSMMSGLEGGAQRLAWWETASRYQLIHALALGLAAWMSMRVQGRAPMVASIGFITGTLLFSGSLYAMTLTGVRVLGAVTPFGGTAFLIGWAALTYAAVRSPSR